jgi:SAM-dependent methyltransferase
MNTKWEECFVHAERGLAFFDGITIQADSINDPRQDRVFPIFKKEQVFMCRQMLPLFDKLKKRLASEKDQPSRLPLALDVGTGSGVLAIWAAKHGCKVYAVDISPRSIEFARHNAEVNRVRVFEKLEDFTNYSESCIFLQQARFGKTLVKEFLKGQKAREEGCFDLIMLNPPYNPTFEKIFPALHADGGPDGQREFKKQIQWVPRLLRMGGYCAGHQMGVIKAGQEHPNVVSEIERAFTECNRMAAAEALDEHKERCHIRCGPVGKYVKVLDRDREVEAFLRAQYATYLAAAKYRDDIVKYIESIAKDWQRFSLLYFDFNKQEIRAGEQSLVDIEEALDPLAKPDLSEHPSAIGWNWETREWLHRCIVEHATSSNSIPWPSLFTDYVVSEQILSSADNPSRQVEQTFTERSPMRLVDQWLTELPPFRSSGTSRNWKSAGAPAQGRRAPFDFIYLESVPFTPNSVRLPGLKQESAVWLTRLDDRPNPLDRNTSETLAKQCFVDWTTCAKYLHKSGLAPFLHAAFLGTAPSANPLELRTPGGSVAAYGNWTPLMQSFLRHVEHEKPEEPEFPPVRPPHGKLHRCSNQLELYDAFDGLFDKLRGDLWGEIKADLQNAIGDQRPPVFLGQTSVGHSPYLCYHDAKTLKDLNVAEVQNYREYCEDRIKKICHDDKDRRTWTTDLEYCHTTLHGLAAQLFRQHLPKPLKWSYFLSVPLDLSDPLNTPEHGVLPSTFRGSVFLFVGSFRDDWNPRQDRLVFDLARFATLLYNGRFNVEEAKSQNFDVLENMGRSFSHEILARKQALHITHQELGDVFCIEGNSATSTEQAAQRWLEPAAVIQTTPDRVQHMSSWLVCPTPKMYRRFEEILSIWGGSRAWLSDQKLNITQSFPEAFSKIVKIVGEATFAAQWSKAPPASPRDFRLAVKQDEEFEGQLEKLQQVLAGIDYKGDIASLSWVGAQETSGVRFTFIRVMEAALGNAIKHLPMGTFDISVGVSLKKRPGPEDEDVLAVEIQNKFLYQKKRLSRADKWGTKKVIETLLRDQWGPPSISFRDKDEAQTDKEVHRWSTAFEVHLSYNQNGSMHPWLKRS